MKKKNVWLALCATFAVSCVAFGGAAIDSVGVVNAEEKNFGETKFSVSLDEESILFVTPLACSEAELKTIYEVGYTFNGETPETVNAATDKYYTALVMGENTMTAADIFGAEFTDETPMIIWEVAYSETVDYEAVAYYKQGTVVDGALYPDYNGVPDEAVTGTAKSTAIYNQVKAMDEELGEFAENFPAINVANFRTQRTAVSTMDAKLAEFGEMEQAQMSNLQAYNEAKNSFMVIDELRDGTMAELKAKFTWGYTGYNGINNGITAPGVASALKDATYGDMVTIGKNANAISFKYNSEHLDLSGYTHVTFMMKNSGLPSAVSFITSQNKRVLAENVAVGSFATIKMTVAEFKNEHVVLFKPDNSSELGGQGSFWMSAIIAVKVDASSEMDEALGKFINEFPTEITPANYRAAQTKIDAMEATLSSLTEAQKAKLSNYAAYVEKKNSFKLIDDLTGLDIASRFNLNAGSNGINNGETAPGVAAALNDATYGPCATIGKNAAGLEISYAATAGLDLSGYNYVLFAVKNNLGVTIQAKNRKSGAVLSSEIASGSFGIVKMTVSEFLNSGVAFWVGNSGSVWISSIIAVK